MQVIFTWLSVWEIGPIHRDSITVAAELETYSKWANRSRVDLNPRFTVVVPEGAAIKMPLAYPIAGNDPNWVRFVNTWIELKERDGFIQALYDHWILGKAVTRKQPRWSVIRDVLHWVR